MIYPRMFLRIKALMMDALIVATIFFSLVFIAIQIDFEHSILRIAFIFLPTLLLEPLMVSFTGSSFGHHYAGLLIVHNKTHKKLPLINSIARYIVKLFFGIISLLSILMTKKYQAIHDYFSGSVVTFKNQENAPENHKLEERSLTHEEKKPAIIKRLSVIFLYSIIWFFCFSRVVSLLFSHDCVVYHQCTAIETTNLGFSVLIFMVGLVTILILGILCKLPGVFYRKPKRNHI